MTVPGRYVSIAAHSHAADERRAAIREFCYWRNRCNVVRSLIIAACAVTGGGTAVPAHAQGKPEKTKVASRSAASPFYYLPLTIAERLGYFKDEGLDVEICDFAGGSKALQAVVGGSADVVAGAFEHTHRPAAEGPNMQGFVLQGRAPQISVRRRESEGRELQVARSQGQEDRRERAGLDHHRHGASTCSPKAGLKPRATSPFIGVGAGAGAIAA